MGSLILLSGMACLCSRSKSRPALQNKPSDLYIVNVGNSREGQTLTRLVADKRL